jgi:hypothetical protein
MSEAPENVEVPDAPVDRKELLERQFTEAEQQVEEAPAVSRDESGKFAKSSSQPKADKAPEVEPPVWKRPPASWKKDYHEPWNTVDDKIKEYVWQREEQMKKGIEPLMSKAQFADAMNQAIETYMNTIRGLGLTPDRAVSALMQADHTLRTAPAEQKLQYLYQLASQYGIDLNAGGSVPQVQPNTYAPILNEINTLKGELEGWKQQQEAAQNNALLTEINGFANKAEFFEEARPAMIQLLQSGMAQTLEEAYDKAIRLDPELHGQIEQARQAEAAAQKSAQLNRAAKAARAAAVSVRSSTPGTHTAPKAQDRRSLLSEQFDGLMDRV